MQKLVRAAASRWVVICDECKKSEGLSVDFPMPVEVAPAFHRTLREHLNSRVRTLDCAWVWRPRAGPAPAFRKTFVTDNGNYVVDLFFREPPSDVWLMASQLNACRGGRARALPGVDAADDPVIVRRDKGVERME